MYIFETYFNYTVCIALDKFCFYLLLYGFKNLIIPKTYFGQIILPK